WRATAGRTAQRTGAAMDAGRKQHGALKRRIPVYIVYTTAWVDEAGRLNFANDRYGHDTRQRALLGLDRPRSTRVAHAGDSAVTIGDAMGSDRGGARSRRLGARRRPSGG